MSPTRCVNSALRALRSAGDAARARQQDAYFKSVTKFFGVATPGVERVHREHVVPALGPSPCAEDILELAAQLLRDEHHEVKHCGVLTFHRFKRRLSSDEASAAASIDCIERLIDEKHVYDWATSDGLSSRGLSPLVERFPSMATRFLAWSSSENPWKRRASAVTFVKLCKPQHDFEDLILEICRSAMRMDHRFVQLGCGWALREASVKNPRRVVELLKENVSIMSREGLRYATEKMDPATRKELMSLSLSCQQAEQDEEEEDVDGEVTGETEKTKRRRQRNVGPESQDRQIDGLITLKRRRRK